MTNDEKILLWEAKNSRPRLENRAKEIVRRKGGTVAQRVAELLAQVEEIKNNNQKSAFAQDTPVSTPTPKVNYKAYMDNNDNALSQFGFGE